MKKLSRKSEEVVEAFDQAACEMSNWEEGVDDEPLEDLEAQYEKTKEALINRLWYLEQRVRHFQAKSF